MPHSALTPISLAMPVQWTEVEICFPHGSVVGFTVRGTRFGGWGILAEREHYSQIHTGQIWINLVN